MGGGKEEVAGEVGGRGVEVAYNTKMEVIPGN